MRRPLSSPVSVQLTAEVHLLGQLVHTQAGDRDTPPIPAFINPDSLFIEGPPFALAAYFAENFADYFTQEPHQRRRYIDNLCEMLADEAGL